MDPVIEVNRETGFSVAGITGKPCKPLISDDVLTTSTLFLVMKVAGACSALDSETDVVNRERTRLSQLLWLLMIT